MTKEEFINKTNFTNINEARIYLFGIRFLYYSSITLFIILFISLLMMVEISIYIIPLFLIFSCSTYFLFVKILKKLNFSVYQTNNLLKRIYYYDLPVNFAANYTLAINSLKVIIGLERYSEATYEKLISKSQKNLVTMTSNKLSSVNPKLLSQFDTVNIKTDKNFWKLFLLALLIAIIVYPILYVFFINK